MAPRSETFDIKFKGKDQSVGRTLKGLDRDMTGFNQKARGFSVGVAGAFASAFAVTQLVGFGKSLFDLGQDMSVWGIKVDTVFGDSAGAVNRWADQINESMGLSQNRVAGLAANMGDLLVPLGATRREAAAMSQNLVGLSGALSAWSGGTYDAAQVSDILAKALLGERESLKSLGISISQAEVNERALTLAKEDGRKEITKLDQARASETLILEKSADAQEAWNNGSLDHIKNLNRLKAAWEDLKITVAEWLTPKVATGIETLLELFEPGGKPIFAQGDEFGSLELTGVTEDGAGLQAAKLFGEAWEEAGVKVQETLDSVNVWWDEHGSTVVDFFRSIGDAASEMYTQVKQSGEDSLTAWEEFTIGLQDSRNEADANLISWQFLGSYLAYMSESVVGVLTLAWEALLDIGSAWWRELKIMGGELSIFSPIVDIAKVAVDGLAGAFGWAKDKLQDLRDLMSKALPRLDMSGGILGGFGIGGIIPERAAGGYITSPELAVIGEGSQNEFVFNASQMRGLAQEGIQLAGRSSNTNSMQPAPVVNVYAEGSILTESSLADLINRLIRDQLIGGANAPLGVI